MKKIVFLLLSVSLAPIATFAQYDSIVNSFQNEFDQFKQSTIENHNAFINHNDSVFISFLKESWEEMEVFKNKKENEPKPVKQPVIKEDTLSKKIPYISPKSIPDLPIKGKPELKTSQLKPVIFDTCIIVDSFNFYGQTEKLYYDPRRTPKINKINKNSISQFYTSLAKNNDFWDYDLTLLNQAKKSYALNDWGFFQLVKTMSARIYKQKNEQALFSWYLLLKSGYDVKIGYLKNNIYLLIPSVQKIYDILYLNNTTRTYYIFDSSNKKIEDIKTYKGNYPGSDRKFSFDLPYYPAFTGEQKYRTISFEGRTGTFCFKKQIFNFLDTYPLCDLNSYFHSGISEYNYTVLDSLLNPAMLNKNNRKKVDLLLNFCQNSLKYETDEEQFGKERYLFAEESFYYPYCDCEDRAILLSTLVKHYTGLSSVALDFPGHVALAVHFPEEEKGTYVTYADKKYIVCDPTYIHAKSGMLPEEFKKFKPEIVTF